MRKTMALVLLLLASAGPSLACEAQLSCSDGTQAFCSTFTGQCATNPVCSTSGEAVCCSTYDPCTQEVDTYCDDCVPTQ